MSNLKEEFPSLCWNCEFARRTWSEELEKQGFVGCSYLLNKNIASDTWLKNREDRETADLFQFTDVNEINEGWIINKRPLDYSKSKTLGEGSCFNFQPIMKNVNACRLYKEKEF